MGAAQGLKERKFTLHAIATETNPSDIHTKALTAARYEFLRKLLGVINDTSVEKGARSTLLAAMLVGSVRRITAGTAGRGTLAAILMAAGTSTAQGQALQKRGAGYVTILRDPGRDYLMLFVAVMCFIAGGIFWWFCTRSPRPKKTHTYEDVYPVNSIEGPYVLRTGTRLHLSASCPHVQGRPTRVYPVCEHCHRHTVQKYEKID